MCINFQLVRCVGCFGIILDYLSYFRSVWTILQYLCYDFCYLVYFGVVWAIFVIFELFEAI